MKLSYSWKLGIVLMIFSVGLTSLCVFLFYQVSYSTLTKQIGKDLLHVGRIGALMFDNTARDAIRRLIKETEDHSIITQEMVDAMASPSNMSSLSQSDIDRLHASDDFKMLVNILSMISLVSFQDMEPKQDTYRIEKPLLLTANGGIAAYISVPIKESPSHAVTKYLVSPAPIPTDDGWPGNPVGNLTKGWTPPDSVFWGTPYIEDKLYTDKFYTSLNAIIPLMNDDGTFLALLGLDYTAVAERNILIQLQYFCYGLIAVSFILSALTSYILCRKPRQALQYLTNAANKVATNDFTVSLKTASNDEFSAIGKVFNQMTESLRNYISALRDKDNQLTSVMHDMHDGVGAILTSITINARRLSETANQDDTSYSGGFASISAHAQKALAEVRFAMNTLDYEQCDIVKLIEEIQTYGAEIFRSSSVKFSVDLSDQFPNIPLGPAEFIGIVRFFREVFLYLVTLQEILSCSFSAEFSDENLLLGLSVHHSVVLDDTQSILFELKNSVEQGKKNGVKLDLHKAHDRIIVSLAIPGRLFSNRFSSSQA